MLKYELMRHNCKMNTWVNMDINTELQGDVNSLVQVFDNIIINAIQAYDGKSGVIDFFVNQQENSILFEIRDYGKGIPESIKDRLLKEMVTTKGRYGTGLGSTCQTRSSRDGSEVRCGLNPQGAGEPPSMSGCRCGVMKRD